MRYAELTFEEAQALLKRGAVALWPIGSTEAHGPHLPLDTDVIIASETASRAVASIHRQLSLEALILPPLALTVTDFASPFSGTLSLPKESVLPFVRDALVAASAQGFKAVCMINAHLEPAHRSMLKEAVHDARLRTDVPIALADPADRRFAATLTEEFKSGDCHAGQYESSLVLAAEPQLVREERRGRLPKVSIDLLSKMKAGAKNFEDVGAHHAYLGDPKAATVEEGEASYARLVEIVIEVLSEAFSSARKGIS